jgi:hypothetical protein
MLSMQVCSYGVNIVYFHWTDYCRTSKVEFVGSVYKSNKKEILHPLQLASKIKFKILHSITVSDYIASSSRAGNMRRLFFFETT